ncbi:MAG: serine protease [Bacteriovoracaceae bacterium]|nr:serine protease [Bacteriovoracaceae bacterium]
MFKLILLTVALTSFAASASNKVVYGDDDRKDIFEVSNSMYLRLAEATAAMVENKQMVKKSSLCELEFSDTLESSENICRGELFSNQPVGAMCSGFLVGEDTLVTAGHCFKMLGGMGYATPEDVCRGFSWVFNYAIDHSGRNPLQGSSNDVYGCKEVVFSTLSRTQDFTVIKLDRKVSGRSPLKFRESGKIAQGAPLVVIGHPSGLPSKVADGAQVISNNDYNTFVTNLDTFHGNSGSAVFDSKSGLLEGILIQGQTDYRASTTDRSSCQVVNHCDMSGKNCDVPTYSPNAPKGEVVMRLEPVLPYIKKALAQ